MDLKITIIISLWLVSTAKSHRSELESFESIRELPFFVDKTEILKLLFNSSSSSSSNPFYFVSCPYNFGKMFNSLMIKKFAEIERDKNNRPIFWMHTSTMDVFKTLKISRHPDIIVNHMARYPVIYLDLWIPQHLQIHDTPAMLMNALRATIVRDYEWLGEILEENFDTVERDFNVNRKDVEFFLNLFNQDITEEDLDDGLLRVSRLLYNYFNQSQVILLIDEYEKVALKAFANANENGLLYYEKLNKMLMRCLIEGRKYIKLALMTGTGSLGFSMDTKKYNLLGLFSFGPPLSKKKDLITHYAFLDNHPFSPYYGFVEEEICAKFRPRKSFQIHEKDILGEGYWTEDGRKIYNAASVTDIYIKAHYFTSLLRPFRWIETDFSKLIVPFVRSEVFRKKMDDAVDRGYFQYPIKKTYPLNGLAELIKLAKGGFEKITKSHVDMFFTICFEQGYFTHGHGKDNFTFPNPSLRTEMRRQLSGLVLIQSQTPEGVRI